MGASAGVCNWTGKPTIAAAERVPGGDGGDDDTGSGANFHGEKRTNETHASKTDPDARLYKKSRGSEAKLSYLGHVMVENRHGFIVDAMLTQADGTAEADAAILMADAMRKKKHGNRFTLGADKAYDSRDLVTTLQALWQPDGRPGRPENRYFEQRGRMKPRA